MSFGMHMAHRSAFRLQTQGEECQHHRDLHLIIPPVNCEGDSSLCGVSV